jgi:hypothetical protein
MELLVGAVGTSPAQSSAPPVAKPEAATGADLFTRLIASKKLSLVQKKIVNENEDLSLAIMAMLNALIAAKSQDAQASPSVQDVKAPAMNAVEVQPAEPLPMQPLLPAAACQIKNAAPQEKEGEAFMALLASMARGSGDEGEKALQALIEKALSEKNQAGGLPLPAEPSMAQCKPALELLLDDLPLAHKKSLLLFLQKNVRAITRESPVPGAVTSRVVDQAMRNLMALVTRETMGFGPGQGLSQREQQPKGVEAPPAVSQGDLEMLGNKAQEAIKGLATRVIKGSTGVREGASSPADGDSAEKLEPAGKNADGPQPDKLVSFTMQTFRDRVIHDSPAVLRVNMGDLIRTLQEQLAGGTKSDHILIRLDPPNLGEMSVKISMENQKLNVQFNVGNSTVRQVLEENISRLVESCVQRGIDVGSFDVSQQGRNQSQEFRPPTPGKLTSADEEISDVGSVLSIGSGRGVVSLLV